MAEPTEQPAPSSNPRLRSVLLADATSVLVVDRAGGHLEAMRDAVWGDREVMVFACEMDVAPDHVADSTSGRPVAWLAYFPDGSGVYAFATELAAHQYAVSSGGMKVIGVLDGECISDAESRLRP